MSLFSSDIKQKIYELDTSGMSHEMMGQHITQQLLSDLSHSLNTSIESIDYNGHSSFLLIQSMIILEIEKLLQYDKNIAEILDSNFQDKIFDDRTKNRLKNNNIMTVRNLVILKYKKEKQKHYVGEYSIPKSVLIVCNEMLSNYNLSFGMDTSHNQ